METLLVRFDAQKKEVAQRYVQPLRFRWDGESFQPVR